MTLFYDYQQSVIRLTDERLLHIMDHPEMEGLEPEIARTLAYPQRIIRSLSDDRTQLYYRLYPSTPVGEKFLCVIVKLLEDDAFILTAYLTDKIKEGEILWTAKS